MKLHHTLVCCFLLTALQDGNTGRVSATKYERKEGEDITVRCKFSFSGSRRLFCKEQCEERNILVDTKDNEAHVGRYRLYYEKNDVLSSDFLFVSIMKLKMSDAGWYRCALERSYLPDSYKDFQIIVTEASTTSTTSSTLTPSSTFLPSASTQTKTTTTTTTTTPQSSSSESSDDQKQSPTSSGSALLCVALILVLLIVSLSATLLLFCKNRRKRSEARAKGPPVETKYSIVSEPNGLYEEIRETDRRKASSAQETTSMYAYVNYSKPKGAEEPGEYSLVGLHHNKVEDDSSNLNYSEVSFTPADPLYNAPPGTTENVIYSTPVSTNLRSATPPLYSTAQL